MNDTFYKVPNRFWKKLLIEAKEVSKSVRIDELLPGKFQRKESKLSFDEALKLLNNKAHFVFIDRKRHYPIEPNHIETGFCTIDLPDKSVFVFIEMEIEKLEYFVEKYKMKEL